MSTTATPAPAAPTQNTTPTDALKTGASNAQKTPEKGAAGGEKAPETGKTDAKSTQTGEKDTQIYEWKSNGKLKRGTLDEMRKAAELADAAHEKFQEAAKLTKKAEAALSRLRNPREAIAFLQDPELGLNPEEVRGAFEEWYSETYIKREKMSPQERELADAKARLKKYEDQEKELEAKKAKDVEEAQDTETRASLQKEIMETIDESGLPKTRFTAQRIAHWMRINLEKGLNAPRALIIQQVQKETREVMDSLVQASDGEKLEKLLGEDTARKLRNHHLQKLRDKRKLGGSPAPEERERTEKKGDKIRMSEVNRRLRIGG